MFPILLALHSLTRWLILITIIWSIVSAYRGYKKHRKFTKADNWLRLVTVSFVHIQLITGGWLYWISPIVDYFLNNFSVAVHQTQARFFGMEHITMMVLGVSLVTIGSSLREGKRRTKKNSRPSMFGTASRCLLSSFLFHGNFHPLLQGHITAPSRFFITF